MNKSGTVRPIRICLSSVHDVARDVLCEIFASHHDITVVELGTEETPSNQGCDVLVNIASARGVPGIDLGALVQRGMPEMLVVTIDGSEVMMFEFWPRQRLIDPSPEALVAAIRDEVAHLHNGAGR